MINIEEDYKATGKKYLTALRNELEEKGYDKITVSAPEGGPPGGAPIDFNVIGDNVAEVKKAAVLAEKILENIDGVININSQLDKNSMGIEFKVDREKMAL